MSVERVSFAGPRYSEGVTSPLIDVRIELCYPASRQNNAVPPTLAWCFQYVLPLFKYFNGHFSIFEYF